MSRIFKLIKVSEIVLTLGVLHIFCACLVNTVRMSKRFHMIHCQQSSTSEAPPRYTELEHYLITVPTIFYSSTELLCAPKQINPSVILQKNTIYRYPKIQCNLTNVENFYKLKDL